VAEGVGVEEVEAGAGSEEAVPARALPNKKKRSRRWSAAASI
jgi:hypothetical protein